MSQDVPANLLDELSKARVMRLTQIYRALSEINQAILRMSDEAELFPLVCRIAVEFGGARMAWIGEKESDSDRLAPVVWHGSGADYVQRIQISVREDLPEGQGPSAKAFRENRNIIINNFVQNPMTAPWHAEAKRFGWGSSGSFPIQRNGQPFAMMSVYHEADDFFDNETVALLDEMTRDISFALDNFDRERSRLEALRALQSSEQHFRAYFERSMVGMAATLPNRNWLEVNPALCEMLGYSADELAEMTWLELTHPDDRVDSEAVLTRLTNREIDDFSLEKRFIRRDGKVVYVDLAVRAIRNEDGSLAYTVSLLQDITQRKLAEIRDQMRRVALEKLAKGLPLKEVLLHVVAGVEAILPDAMCSILLLDEGSKHLMMGAAPSLPDFYNNAINGVEIGAGVGSCGTAAYTGKRVVVDDIGTHPYWILYRDIAAKAGLAACWSEPIRIPSGKVSGTFAIYHSTPSAPDANEIAIIESAANLVGLAIERRRAEEELHLASSIYRSSAEAMLVTDADNQIVAINPAFTKVTGYTLEEVIGRKPSILRSGRHTDDFFRLMWQDITKTGLWQGEIWNRRKNGEIFPEWLTINTIRDEDGQVQRYVALGSDITNKVRSDELIWHQANYDFLTELPNRYMFQDRLNHELRKAHREGSLLGLLFIDLDRFKDVNDTLGHQIGDLLLIQAAVRIKDCVRESDTVARLGGDEFTVILTQLADPADAEQVAEQIISVLAEPFSVNGETVYISGSIGITFYPEDSGEVDQLLSNADQAMYAAKEAGRNRLSYFTKALHDSAQHRLKLINDLRVALAARQFELHFQPIIDLSNGLVVKAEALLRWHHPDIGMISPAEFIPLAEETGLIVEIGDWVFRETAGLTRRWAERFGQGLQVSVNMSPVQFQSDALKIEDWLGYLSEIGADQRNLSVEITEGLLLNVHPEVTDRLLRFREAGIQLAIDDFGTGYSALSYLKRFHIDYLKIDQSFVRNLEAEHNDLVLVEAIVVMAHKMGLKVIAEGVETDAQRRLLVDTGCDYGQGYLFSRPLPVADFERFIADNSSVTP
ncbi:EAL domain-containing protein [Mangrovitalea sediminis]|uniref:EAL domain-containing protein n=1 Tax=Mangrovitalea sediminis TaxID=1982043 RepID=UPI000BE4D22C|nr:EAL domain-containing protein [Mangrovitalea sediminis]